MRFADYFDRVRIISLPERTDRRKRVTRELERIGLPLAGEHVSFFDAIRVTEAASFPTAGYRGCFLSHATVLREAVRDGVERLLVLEDDVVFHPQFGDLEANSVHRLTQCPWGIALLGYVSDTLPTSPGLHPCPRSTTGTHMYAVARDVLPRLSAWFDEVPQRTPSHPLGGCMSPDGTLNHFRWANPDVRALVTWPRLGDQSNSPSDLAGRRWFDRVPLFRNISPMLRYGCDVVAGSLKRK